MEAEPSLLDAAGPFEGPCIFCERDARVHIADAIVDRYESGELMGDLAAEHGLAIGDVAALVKGWSRGNA